MKKILILAFLFAMQLQFAYAWDPNIVRIGGEAANYDRDDDLFRLTDKLVQEIPDTYLPCYDNDPTTACSNWDEWQSSIATVYHPSYPNCPIRVYFKHRLCISDPTNIQHLITKLAVNDNDDCHELYEAITGSNDGTSSTFISMIRHDIYGLLAKDIFLDENSRNYEMTGSFLYCNIYDHVRISYIEGSCVGYCMGFFTDPNNENRSLVSLPRTCDISNCCKVVNYFCVDETTNRLKHVEEMTSLGSDNTTLCNSYPSLEACAAYMSFFPNLEDVLTYQCQPTCNIRFLNLGGEKIVE